LSKNYSVLIDYCCPHISTPQKKYVKSSKGSMVLQQRSKKVGKSS
jgi:hypothetical protein